MFEDWKAEGLSNEEIQSKLLKLNIIDSGIAPVNVNALLNLYDNGASKDEILAFASAAIFNKLVGKASNAAGKGTTEQVTTNNLGSSAHNAANYEKLKLDLNTTESANNVVESLRNTGQLPPNYVNKTQAVQQGWAPGKALNNTVPGGQIGGDIFHNTTGVLPTAPGRIWYEADIGLSNTMSRSNQQGTRLLYSNDGLLYITTDHYKTATQIGRWK